MKKIEKEKARLLRKEGKSIKQIAKEIDCAKSSVSVWVRDVLLTEKQRKLLSEKGKSVEVIERNRLSRLRNESQKRRLVVEKAKEDFSKISKEELKLIGIILYLGEGGKTKRMVRVTNSDPSVIKIMMKFFREICNVSENKFRGSIHTFSHADIDKTEEYWSKITGIPRNQFYKTYSKPSCASLGKRDTLPWGTFDITVCDTRLFLTIMGWIERIKELLV